MKTRPKLTVDYDPHGWWEETRNPTRKKHCYSVNKRVTAGLPPCEELATMRTVKRIPGGTLTGYYCPTHLSDEAWAAWEAANPEPEDE